MHGPARVLDEEHRVIEHVLHIVSSMAARLDRGVYVSRDDLEATLDILANFADKCHHAKEEKVLFPALREADPVDGNRIADTLEADHRLGRNLVVAMREVLPGVAVGNEEDTARFAQLGRRYVELLKGHIKLERDRLLPLSELVLSVATRRRVAEEFERVEREETGAFAHEKYEHMIHRLAQKYVHAET